MKSIAPSSLSKPQLRTITVFSSHHLQDPFIYSTSLLIPLFVSFADSPHLDITMVFKWSEENERKVSYLSVSL